MNKLLALFVLVILMMGLMGTVYASYASSTKFSVFSEDDDDDHGYGGGSSDSSSEEEHHGDSGYSEFMEKYHEAMKKLSSLRSKLDSFNSSGYNVSQLYDLLSQASDNLNLAIQAYNNSDYSSAWSYLNTARGLLKSVEKAIKEMVKGGNMVVKTSVHHDDDHDEDEDDYLEYVITNGNITISSKDNKVDFGSSRPCVEFTYTRNNTKVKFEIEDFVFIEFKDLNGNGQIDSDEVLQQISSKDLSWISNVSKNTFDNNTEIVISYYTNSSNLELELIMHIYNYSVLQNATIGNKTVTIKVDGGADQIKYDFIVYRWPWMSNESKLALYNKIEIKIGSGVSLKSINADEDVISVDLGVVNVMVSWIKYATVDGSPVNVSTYYRSLEIESGNGSASLELKVFFVYPYFGDGILVHDPSIGVVKEFLSIVPQVFTIDTLLILGAAVLMVTAVATVLARKGYIASVI